MSRMRWDSSALRSIYRTLDGLVDASTHYEPHTFVTHLRAALREVAGELLIQETEDKRRIAEAKACVDSWDKLEGLTVLGAYEWDGDIVLETDKGWISFVSEAGCCSSSWIEHISGVDALVGEVITDVEPVDYDSEDSEFGVTQMYSYVLRTRKGRFEVELRNESNGYYGGSLEVREVSRPQTSVLPLRELKDK